MTNKPNPNDEINNEISSLRSKLSELEKRTRLVDIRDAVEDMQADIHGFKQKISSLRSCGYVFGKDFESQAEQFAKQWAQMSTGILAQINTQASRLQNAFSPVQQKSAGLSGGNMIQARTLLSQLKPQVDSIESQVQAAEAQLKGMYNSFQSDVNHLSGQVYQAETTMTQIEEASFQLLATEGAVASVKAVYVKDGKEDKSDPDGVLILTDQRIIFEQKEEVATKKILFITTETKKVQNLLFEAPVALVEKVEPTKQGLFKNEDNIELTLAPGADVQRARFHIWEDCKEWQALINRVKTRDIDKDRAVAMDAAAEAKVKAAPSQCPNCGGNISQVILRGQDSIKCGFCGTVIRL